MRLSMYDFAKKLGISVDDLLNSEAEAYELIAKYNKVTECLKSVSNKYNVDIRILLIAFHLGYVKAVVLSDKEIEISRRVAELGCMVVEALGKKAYVEMVKKSIEEGNGNDSMLPSYG